MYAKFFQAMLRSSVWVGQPYHVRIAWVGMVLMADEDGYVYGTKKALANALDMPLEDFEAAIKVLTAPDPESSSQEHEGRRILPVGPNLWFIVNYQKYRRIARKEDRNAYMREYMREYRKAKSQESQGRKQSVNKRKQALADVRGSEAEANTEADINCLPSKEGRSSSVGTDDPPPAKDQEKNKRPPAERTPYQAIVDLYVSILVPPLRRPVLNDSLKRQLKARHRDFLALMKDGQIEQMEPLEAWRRYFEGVKQCPFLLGQKTDFQADLRWLTRPTNFAKVLEGRYEDRHEDGIVAWIREAAASEGASDPLAWLKGEEGGAS